eukprot:TRINITY_DN931_c0_g1_i1.p1 TRINITY_DN931_c0_g1~~TRINITY_DN931_c0_g1_i1.p1  ORF type:complete len:263 (-),score=64.53 TRINITY_DN931_c0_g1_i1:68-856(-)
MSKESEPDRKKQKLSKEVFYAYFKKDNDEKIKKAFDNIKKTVGLNVSTKKVSIKTGKVEEKIKKLWKDEVVSSDEIIYYKDDVKIGNYSELEAWLKSYKEASKPKFDEISSVSSPNKSPSKPSEKTKQKPKVTNKAPSESVLSLSDYLNMMTVPQLKSLSKKLDVDGSGKKQEIIDRLEEAKCPVDLSTLTNNQIKKLLREHHLDTTGNKSQMIERLTNPETAMLEKALDDLRVDKLKAMLNDRGLPTTFQGLLKMVGRDKE